MHFHVCREVKIHICPWLGSTVVHTAPFEVVLFGVIRGGMQLVGLKSKPERHCVKLIRPIRAVTESCNKLLRVAKARDHTAD